MTLYDQMLTKSNELEHRIQTLQSQLSDYPPGKLICARNGKYQKYYLSENAQIQYLKKSDLGLAELLAAKKYIVTQLEDIQNEKKAIDSYLKQYAAHLPQASSLLSDSSGYRKLLCSYFSSNVPSAAEWQQADYEKNPNYPEQLIHKTLSGNIVRSKSESLIDTSLYLNKIPFRYECALHLDHFLFYPDFTIYRPETNDEIYWEHFGMMNDESYSKKVFSKLQIYNAHGIIPSINLIATFEDNSHPLASDQIERIIQLYLR